jgi:hypothetical protein
MRVFISYAHDDGAHEDRVRGFWSATVGLNTARATVLHPGLISQRQAHLAVGGLSAIVACPIMRYSDHDFPE